MLVLVIRLVVCWSLVIGCVLVIGSKSSLARKIKYSCVSVQKSVALLCVCVSVLVKGSIRQIN